MNVKLEISFCCQKLFLQLKILAVLAYAIYKVDCTDSVEMVTLGALKVSYLHVHKSALAFLINGYLKLSLKEHCDGHFAVFNRTGY